MADPITCPVIARVAILSRTRAKYRYPGNVQANRLLPRPTVPSAQIIITNAKSLYIDNYRESTRIPRWDKLQSLLKVNIERALSDVWQQPTITLTWTQHCYSYQSWKLSYLAVLSIEWKWMHPFTHNSDWLCPWAK